LNENTRDRLKRVKILRELKKQNYLKKRIHQKGAWPVDIVEHLEA